MCVRCLGAAVCSGSSRHAGALRVEPFDIGGIKWRILKEQLKDNLIKTGGPEVFLTGTITPPDEGRRDVA